MRKRVQNETVNQINKQNPKHYSIIVDAMSDVTHIDQLLLVVRYSYNKYYVRDFLTFYKQNKNIYQDLVQENTTNPNLSHENIRGQLYDNAFNMKG